MNKKTKKIVLVLLALFFFFQSTPALAIEVFYPPVPGAETPHVFMERIEGTDEENQAFALYVKYVYHLVIFLSGIAFLYALIRGGITYMLSTISGSALQAKSGLDIISNGVIGILIVLSSYIILNTLDPNLLVFQIGDLDSVTGGGLPIYEEAGPERNIYTEIPMAGLIQNTKEWGEIVYEKSRDVWFITSVKADPYTLTIPEVSMCLQILVNECNCAIQSDCGEYLDPDDAQRCSHGCEEYEGSDCPDSPSSSFCEDDVDPCDITELPDGFPISQLCTQSAYAAYGRDPDLLCFSGECLDQDIGLPDNLRDAINSMQGHLETLIRQAQIEIAHLLYVRQYLQLALNNQVAAENLIRDTLNRPLNYQTFAGIEDKDVEYLWPYLEPHTPGAPGSGPGSNGDTIFPPDSCNGECPAEDTPSCQLCGELLVCFGNEYRCCETGPIPRSLCDGNDSCTNPPPVYEQFGGTWEDPSICCINRAHEGCVSPRQCQDAWFPADSFPSGTVLFNSLTFEVPSGGVHFIGSNTINCNWFD